MTSQERPESSRSDELVENGAFRRIGRSTPVDLVDAEPAKVLQKKKSSHPQKSLATRRVGRLRVWGAIWQVLGASGWPVPAEKVVN